MNQLINIQNQQGKLTVSSRGVAENFEKEHTKVIRAIEDLIGGIAKNVDTLFIETEYQHEQNKQVYKEYLLTRDGFSLLVMGFTGAKALEWKLKYIEAFNQMEEEIKKGITLEGLSPQLQLLIGIERKQKEHDKALIDTNNRIDNIKDIVSLDTTSWRQDSKNLVAKIALEMGGYEFIREVQRDIYKTLNNRFSVSLEIRLTNKRRRMAEEGVSKSKRDKVTRIDIIAEDKKPIEGYIAIIKEMAVKHGVADVKEAQG